MPTHPHRRHLLSGIAATGAAAAVRPALAQDAAPGPVVEISTGKIRGLQLDGALAFKGIPYGADTGGENRFLPPRPVKPWTGVRDTIAFGERAPQHTLASSAPTPEIKSAYATNDEPEGEDCLVLNVYTPALDHGRRPVMVWLHGGGYVSGSGGPGFEGRDLAVNRDVVLVTVNHRLNVFGFLNLSDIDPRYAESGNAGMLDITKALAWVHENIHRFGGDPGCVTIFGQSGGGAKVSNCLVMPSAKGFVHRAIPESGAVVKNLTVQQSLELAEALRHQLGVGRHDIAALQALPAKALLDAMYAIGSTGEFHQTRPNFSPSTNGRSIPHDPFYPHAATISAGVPLMVGSTHDETRLFYVFDPAFPTMTEGQAKAKLMQTMLIDAAWAERCWSTFRKALPDLSVPDLFIQLTTQYNFGNPSRKVAVAKARQGVAPAFLYRFDWVSPGPMGAKVGAAHATEVPLVFDQQHPHRLIDDTPAARAMADRMSRVWTTFARTGNPNGAGADFPHWPKMNEAAWPTMLINTECRVVDDPDPELRKASVVLPDFHP